MDLSEIILKKVNVHNLKSVNLILDKNELVVFTGVSGSGKSSLAFDTLYVEGQRRYVESLSTFARRQLGEMSKPNIEHASGITPTISIEQKTAGKNPRSTVGTMTEVYDYLRVLFARVATPYCPVSHEPLLPVSRDKIIKTIQMGMLNEKIILLSPYAKAKKAEFKEDFQDLLRKGFTRARVDGNFIDLNETLELDGSVAHDVDIVIDRISVNPENYSRIAESVTTALNFGNGILIVWIVKKEEETLFSTHAYSIKSGLYYSSLEPQDFSFNSPGGMCPDCLGIGVKTEFDQSLIIDENLSIEEDCCSIASSYQTVRYGNIYDNLSHIYKFSVKTPWKNLSKKAKQIFLYGTEKKWTKMHFVHPETGSTWTDHIQWRGVLYEAHARFAEAKSDAYRNKMKKLMKEQTCPLCEGDKLKAYPRSAKLDGKTIAEITKMTINESLNFFNHLKLKPQEELIANELLKEIKERLQFLMEVGLHYLTLDRTAPTLSGGEAQRVRLASQIGCGLVGITYILDEPSIGLHPRDNKKLINTLKQLRDMGNSVIVVEHDEETIREADRIVDVGPGPGIRGGEIVVNGSFRDLIENEKSYTGQYLSGKLNIEVPKKRRKPSKEVIEVKGATHHNLKNINVKFPLGLFTAVTGVSGSGKSSLVIDILYPALSNHLHQSELVLGAVKEIQGMDKVDKVIAIDQSPIGRNPRSNPSTYIKLFDEIRDLYSELPESKARGYKPGRFSFNVKEGSCPECDGMGMIKIDMDFMEDAFADCPLCETKRFDHETLSIFYKGKNIYDVLEMEVQEALEFFQNIPSIKHKLEMLKKVGLDYIKLGQFSTTLSGGEAQRVKLAKELSRPSTGKTIYILDEPTTGLHFHDIKHLLIVLHELVERGNTVIVIEHNMDVIKTSDWIIDIGPDGGSFGGQVVATGKPEEIAKMKTPTGEFLQLALKNISPEIKDHPVAIKKESIDKITVIGAEQNNLKNLDVSIPRGQMTVCTGPSGSGKSSFAFETIYAEGQRRYIESLSPYARQFVKQMPKPKVASVSGLSPAIAIEQKSHAGNPRSTIGTMTEIYDYLRILFARIGIPHCPETKEVIQAISKEHVVKRILDYPEGIKIQILAPIELKKHEKFEDLILKLKNLGFVRIRLNGQFFDLDQPIENFSFNRKLKNEICLVIDRLKNSPTIQNRLYEAVENAARFGQNKLIVMKENEDQFFNLSFSVESTGKSYPEITPHTFSFNDKEGYCPECLGLGIQYGANLMENEHIMHQSVFSLMKLIWQEHLTSESKKILLQFLNDRGIDPYAPLHHLKSDELHTLMYGSKDEEFLITQNGFKVRFLGINEVFAKAGKAAHSEIKQMILNLLEEHDCVSCKGTRLNPLARHVTINQLSIADLCRLPIDQAYSFIEKLKISKENKGLLEEIHIQLKKRLSFLCEVGLHYIQLERRAPTLSGGEAQRIRLARQLGSGLTGVLYVLDEPTIGLHPRDNERLNKALKDLKSLGNTLILVEHDPLTIKEADYILDFGPKAGIHGGHITAQGTLKEIKKNKNSLTGLYLSNKISIPTSKPREIFKKGTILIENASLNNLKNVSCKIPVSALTLVTGVSGSGKSTLINQVLLPAVTKGLLKADSIHLKGGSVSGIHHFDKMISIDQNPIGQTVRSDVGTYVDLLPRMRDFFAALPQAEMKGLQPGNFSYNHRKGMCPSCSGLGYKRIEMLFLPEVKVECEDCKGLRLNPLSLTVTYDGKNFGEWLDTTVEETKIAFQNHPRIVRILDTLISVGLGYLKLGQETSSLSGGEAQRIKLSRELAKRTTGKTLYLLDEPTTGLHSDDISKLLSVLHKLVDKGNTMVIIEHNMDMIKNADYLIDLGKEAGKHGGNIIFEGTASEILNCKESYTGMYLKKYLSG